MLFRSATMINRIKDGLGNAKLTRDILFEKALYQASCKAAIKAGIRKMNIGTDVCCAFAQGAKAELDNPNRSIAVDLFMKPSIESVKKLALNKIALTGALGKA